MTQHETPAAQPQMNGRSVVVYFDEVPTQGYNNASLYEMAAPAATSSEEVRKLADWMIAHSFATGHGDSIENLLKELEWQVQAARRKAQLEEAQRIRINWNVADRDFLKWIDAHIAELERLAEQGQ